MTAFRRQWGWVAALAWVWTAQGEDVLFRADFKLPLDVGWSWIREDRSGWRTTRRGLELRVQPGNMWGSANNARNVLVRPLPVTDRREIEVSAVVENHPTERYEQVDLVYYLDDRHMVKLGQELVDGRLCLVMGREEADQTRTIAIAPIDLHQIELKLLLRGERVRGYFRAPKEGAWRLAGECSVPFSGKGKVSLQAYQGPAKVERWAVISDLTIRALKRR